MLNALLLAGSLLPLVAMLVALFAIARIRAAGRAEAVGPSAPSRPAHASERGAGAPR